jgi:hypothetical protein
LRYLILGLLFLSACEHIHYEKVVSIDPAFQEFVAAFEYEAAAHGHKIIIDNLYAHFAQPGFISNDLTLGECFMKDHGRGGTPVILINKEDWDRDSYMTNKVMFLHELGHGVLFREHILTHDGPNGNVTSIMFPYIQDDEVYTSNWEYYMRELFYDL